MGIEEAVGNGGCQRQLRRWVPDAIRGTGASSLSLEVAAGAQAQKHTPQADRDDDRPRRLSVERRHCRPAASKKDRGSI